MKRDILEEYKTRQSNIKSRLNNFKNLPESQYFKEFQFCLLTPQSQARKCWLAVEELSKLKNPDIKEITQILKSKTRFHNTKAERILNSRENFNKILPLLSNNNIIELRNNISKQVNGYGLKEAGHFIRNIGKSNNKIAILDRHILRNLKNLKVIDTDKIKSSRHYLEIEQKFMQFSEKVKIPIDELDLLFWSIENGEIFK